MALQAEQTAWSVAEVKQRPWLKLEGVHSLLTGFAKSFLKQIYRCFSPGLDLVVGYT